MALLRFHFGPLTAALAGALLFGSALLGAGCSGTEDDGGDAASQSSTGRQRGDGDGPATRDESAANSEPDDEDDEVSQSGDELGDASNETEGPPEDADDSADGEADDALPARVFAACFAEAGPYEDCDSIYVTLRESDPPRCVQLTIDNCGSYGSPTLGVDAPPRWDLSSGSIGPDPEDCELGVFNASNTIIVDASGTISWDRAAASPTDLELELILEPSRTGAEMADLDIATTEPLAVEECAD